MNRNSCGVAKLSQTSKEPHHCRKPHSVEALLFLVKNVTTKMIRLSELHIDFQEGKCIGRMVDHHHSGCCLSFDGYSQDELVNPSKLKKITIDSGSNKSQSDLAISFTSFYLGRLKRWCSCS